MNNIFAGRKYIIGGIFLVVCVACIIRLFYMQVIDESLKLDASNETFRHITQYPPRGCIYDRKGRLLVTNEAAYDILVTPSLVKDFDTNSFCSDLGITKSDFIAGIKKAIIQNTAYHSTVFMKEVTPEIYAAFQEKLYKYHGFTSQVRTIRRYPMKVAPHILGYIGEVDKELCARDSDYKEGDYIGISGIEESYENDLKGKKGVKIMMFDAMNKEVGDYKNGEFDTLPVTGENLTCTIDAKLQAYGEKLMQNKAGSIVAIDPETGEILALVSSPYYDPNMMVGSVRAKNYATLLHDSINIPLFNRALMAMYPPGSTFKTIEALIGQQEGVLNENTSYTCGGAFHIGNVSVACDAAHGTLQLEKAIALSCNTYFCNVFMSIMNNKKYNSVEDAFASWRRYVTSFGIGIRPDIDLPSALRGSLPTENYYDKYHGKGHWKGSTIISLAIGQGELGITPLQLANQAAIIGNRGYYFLPHVIRPIGDDPTTTKYATKHFVPIEPQYFDIVADGMCDVVNEGTAAASKIPGVVMCGKTGTAQNPNGRNNSLFIAFAPKDHPRIAISVVVERGGWGASWAAPIASLMIEKYLNDTIKRTDIETRMLAGNTIQYLADEKMAPKKKHNKKNSSLNMTAHKKKHKHTDE
jgi:penicillin-binding protein 2